MSNPTHRGVVFGNTVVVQGEIGLPDGQEVEVHLATVARSSVPAEHDRLAASFGAWSDDQEGLDEFLAWTHEQRKLPRRSIEP